MRQYLEGLKNQEGLSRLNGHSFAWKVREMNMKEALNGAFPDPKDWQQVWNQPLRGRALDALETKMQLHLTDTNG